MTKIVLFAICFFVHSSCMKRPSSSTKSSQINLQETTEECGPRAFQNEGDFNYFSLKSKIKGTKTSKKQLFSQVLSGLMGESKTGPNRENLGVLAAYRSNSIQKASAQFPRIIIFKTMKEETFNINDLPYFIAAANGTDEDPSIEILEFSKSEMRFCPRRITVSKSNVVFEDHPATCADCHGKDTKPIWEPYPEWPGFWGSLERIAKTSEEYKSYNYFLDNYSQSPFYKDTLEEFIEPNRNLLSTFYDEGGSVTTIFQLSQFSNTIQHLNFMRINRKLKQDQTLQTFNYALLAAMIGCAPIESFFSETFLKTGFISSYADTYAETGALISKAGKERFAQIEIDNAGINKIRPTLINQDFARKSRLDAIAKMRWIIEKRKLNPGSMKDWSTSHYSDAYAFTGNANGLENLAAYFYTNLIESDPQFSFLRDPNKFKFTNYNNYNDESNRLEDPNVAFACEKLQTASLAATQQIE